MRHDLHSFALPSAAYLLVALLSVFVWMYAPTAFAGNARSLEPIPPLPHPKPTRQARRSVQSFISRPSRRLGNADELATLHAIHTALSSVGDGGAFVWQRGNGLLSGLIRPTTSFKTRTGEVCRHIIVRLDSGRYSREVEGIACRDQTGAWSLSG